MTDIAAEVAALGLPADGYRDPDTGRVYPWDQPVPADLCEPDDGPWTVDGPGDRPYTVWDWITDQAGVQGMYVDEYWKVLHGW